MNAVKRKVKLSQISKSQDGADELALQIYIFLKLVLKLSPSPPGFVYYVLQNLQRESLIGVDVVG